MKITLLTVGKADKKMFVPAQNEYLTRICRFMPAELVELPEGPAVRQGTQGEIRRVIETEGSEILARINPGDFVIAMCIDGKQYSSEDFAKKISDIMMTGRQRCVFVIGGSHGLSDEVVKRADMKLSLGKATLPHQLARIVLLEQIFRGFTIINNITYHK